MATKLLKKKQEKGIFSRIRTLNNKRAIIGLVTILIAMAIFNSYQRRNTVNAETILISSQDLTDSITASGKISAQERVDLNFLSAGEISTITVKEGDIVQKGQVVARLDSTNLYQAYLQAEANLRQADATRARVYDEIKGRDDTENFIDREKRTTAEAARDVAYRSFVQSSQNLSNATLRAPFSGLVAFITEGLAPGFYVTPATAEIIIVDPDTAIFEADVNEVSISRIYLGQKVNISLDAYPEDQIEGTVSRIGVTAVTTSTGGTAYPVEVTLPGSIGLKYKIGMNGDAEFVLERKDNVLTVPITALVEEDNKEFVWIVEEGFAKRVQVETGISSINDIEITNNLSEGQIIIVRPPSGIEEGMRIVEENE